MTYKETTARLAAYRREIAEIRKRMREAQAAIEPEEIKDYQLENDRGPVRLSSFFGDKADLILVHNMGMECPYCTLWADGYNGIHEHLIRRAAFVITSPDAPADQRKVAVARGWRFPMASHRGSTFADDMGYRSETGRWLPGLSVFSRQGQKIVRVSDARSEPGDDFCSLFHIFDLLPGGPGSFRPRPHQP